MQFLQLYGRQKLNASLLKVQQQKNLVDCGVFAIAFCTEYCYTGRKGGVADWIWHYENERPSPQLYWKYGTHALSEIEKEVETAKTNWKSA